jgi:hypothetical protein
MIRLRKVIVLCAATPQGLKTVAPTKAGRSSLLPAQTVLSSALLAFYARKAAAWGCRLHLEIVPDGEPDKPVMDIDDWSGWPTGAI